MGKNLTAALRQQSDILDTLPANVALLDHTGVIISINRAWMEFAEQNDYKTAEYGLGVNYIDVCRDALGSDAELGHTAATGLAQVLNGQLDHFELEYPCHSSKQRRWFQLVARPIDLEGSTGIVVMHVDITKQKKAELALAQSQEFYQLVIGNISDTVLMTDEQGFFTYICPNVKVIFGYTDKEVAERETVDRFFGTQLFENELSLVPGQIHTFDHETLDKWGDLRTITITVKHVEIGDGTFLFTCHDITQRRLVEKKLLNTLSTLEATIESTGDGIAIIGTHGRFTAYNRRAVEMWNIPKWMLITGDAIVARAHMLDQLRDRDNVAKRLAALDSRADEITYDVLELLDGRTIERYSFPQMRDNERIGTILNYRDITERRQAEIALRESEQRYRRIVENAVDAIFVADMAGHIIDVNGYACNALGYSREEMLRMTVADFRQGFDSGVHPLIWAGLDYDNPVTIEGVHIRKDGTTFPVEIRLVKFATESENQLLALARDITERRHAVEDVNNALSLLSATFESTADGIAAIDRDGDLMTYNHRLLDLWDIEIDLEATNRSEQIRRITAPCLRPNNEDFPASLGMLGSPETTYVVLELVDNRILERFSQPQLIGNKNVGWVLSFHDITERESARRQLREQSNLLRAVIDSSEDAVFARDREHRFLMANRSFGDYYAQWTDVIVGRTIYDILPPDEDFDFLEFDQQVIATGKPVTYEETVTWGTKRRLLVTKAPMRGSHGEIIGIVGTARDITERYRHEEEKSRMLSLLTATLESATDGIVVVDLDRNSLIHNGKLIEMWGVPQSVVDEGDTSLARNHFAANVRNPQEFLDRTETIYASPEEGSFDVLECNDGRIIERHSQPQILNGRVVGRVWSFRDITARHHAAEAIAESETRFRRLVENAADCFFLHDQDGNFIDVNNRACEHLGYSREEFLQISVADIEMNVESEGLRQIWHGMELDSPLTVEGRHRRKDGSVMPVEVRLTKFKWRGELQIVALARDITERKEAEETVRSIEAKLAHLLANSPAIVYSLRYDGNNFVPFWTSENSRHILGYSIEETMQPTWWIAHVHPDDRDAAVASMNDLMEEGANRAEYRFRYKNGTYRWIADDKRLIRDRDNNPTEIIGLWVDITERKQAELNMLESRNLLNAVIETASDAIFARSTDGVYLTVNTADAKLIGSTPEQMLGKNIKKILSPERSSTFIAYDQDVITSGTSVTYEASIEVDGQCRTILFTKEPLRDSQETIIGLIGIGRDITERKQAEEAVRSAQTKLTYLLANSPALLYSLKHDGNDFILYWASENSEQVLGYSPEEVLQPGWWYSNTHPDDLDAAIATTNNLLKEDFNRTEYRFRYKDGTYHWIADDKRLIHDDDGNPVEVIGSWIDITERKQVELELFESRNLLNAVIEAASDAIFARSIDGVYLTVNTADAKLMGSTPEQMLGRNVSEIVSPQMDPIFLSYDQGVIEQGTSVTYETPMVINGQYRTILFTKEPLRDSQGTIIGLVGIGRDITERKQAEERITEALSMLSATLESTADGIIVTDSNGHPIANNQKFVDMWNLTNTTHLLHDSQALWQYMAQQTIEADSFIEQMSGRNLEENALIQDTFDCRDGRVFERYSQPNIVKGRSVGRVWSFRDVTPRITAERELRESKNLLHYVIEAAEDSIFARDLEGNYLLVNSAAARGVNKRPEEVIGHNVRDFSDESHLNLLQEHDQQIIADGGSITFEHPLPNTDPVRTALTTKAPLRDDRGRIIGIVGVGRDITNRIQAEETLRNLSNYIIDAQESERRRVALELHDGVNQMLSAAKFKIQAAERKLAETGQPTVSEVAQVREMINNTIAEVRNISKNLRPSVLDDLGFVTALKSLCQEFSERTEIKLALSCDELPQRLPRRVEVTLFRIIQESLNNIEKHSGATSVDIFLILTDNSVNVIVRDNGKGFDTEATSRRKDGAHLGLVGMKERAGYVSGTATIESKPGKGTLVRVSIPSDIYTTHGGETP